MSVYSIHCTDSGSKYSAHYTCVHGNVRTAPMSKKQRLSIADLERETEKYLSPATEKEKAIIDAAVELIGKRGVDGATTAEIARQARVTEKTLFRYFPSKQDLIRRVLFPQLLRGALTREWEKLESMLRMEHANLKSWYVLY